MLSPGVANRAKFGRHVDPTARFRISTIVPVAARFWKQAAATSPLQLEFRSSLLRCRPMKSRPQTIKTFCQN